jgi:tRNA G10  N-methylase Trm11
MAMFIHVLGRQPEIGSAELESLYGAAAITRLGDECAAVDIGEQVPHERIGGTIKIAEYISKSGFRNMSTLSSFVIKEIVGVVASCPTSVKRIGISAYGIRTNPSRVISLSFTIKRRLEQKKLNVKLVIPRKDTALNTAQVMYNGLDGKEGYEFIVSAGEREVWIGKTKSIQDINSYSKRDYGRPKRDPSAGMLPPKLAQIMLNLAKVSPGSSVLDPFCGTGVIPMEAGLMGAKAIGCDINKRMVEYTKENMGWLSKENRIGNWKAFACDAVTFQWKEKIDHVVTEVYLGPRLHGRVKDDELRAIIDDCDTLLRKFLANLSKQIAPKTRCCIAVPAWFVNNRMLRVPTSRKLDRIGYKRIEFRCAKGQPLIYHREGQSVGRELLVIEKV